MTEISYIHENESFWPHVALSKSTLKTITLSHTVVSAGNTNYNEILSEALKNYCCK